MSLGLHVNGSEVKVLDEDASLLQVLRDQLGLRAAKDGCSPQGQCGCCTVWVDGSPRAACVTPSRRVAGRSVTTLEGLADDDRRAWSEAIASAGASQCGFCTPGIVMRLEALRRKAPAGRLGAGAVERDLLAHLCRCTGWRTIVQAATEVGDAGHLEARGAGRDLAAASRRAFLEGGSAQQVGPTVALGQGGFADDCAPAGCLVAVPDGRGGWAVGESLAEARGAAGRVQGRRSSAVPGHPLELPAGDWDLTLRTTWVDPAYLETDASWCAPGGEPATPLGNGGAFGGKVDSPTAGAARQLADAHGRPVRVLMSREDVITLGPKRPPIAAGLRLDGTGVMRAVRCPGLAARVALAAPGIAVEEVDVEGPAVSASLRGAGWAEAAVLMAVLDRLRLCGADPRAEAAVSSPGGGAAEASFSEDGRLRVRVSCGEVLDEVVLSSYCVGAAHMALSWVRSEGMGVDDHGAPLDLTLRSLGVLPAREMPEVDVQVEPGADPAVNGSDAVFAAVAAAAWIHEGLPECWPTRRAPRR